VLIFKGIDVKSVQNHLGHSTPTTTLSIYRHEFQQAQTAVTDAITSVISFSPIQTAEFKQ